MCIWASSDTVVLVAPARQCWPPKYYHGACRLPHSKLEQKKERLGTGMQRTAH